MLYKVIPSNDGVSITPQKKHGRAYFMGTVMLTDARVRIDPNGFGYSLTGEIIHEATEQVEPTHKVRGRMDRYTLDMGEITSKAAYVVGGRVYVSKEIQ
jgi:hypothetical protein